MRILSNSLANLLSKSKFASLFSNSHNKNLKLLGSHQHEGILYFSLLPTNKNFSSRDDDVICFNFPRFGRYLYPVASCKSLLLSYVDSIIRTAGVALWNPTTDEVKKLPDCPRDSQVWSYGFGFDPSSQDYKVIRFVLSRYGYGNRARPSHVELYSLKTDSWKDITSPYPHFNVFMNSSPSIHINGFCYWAVDSNFILSFDFANEKFSSPPYIPLPKTDKLRGKPGDFYSPNLFLADFHGSLAAIVYTDRDHCKYFLTERKKEKKEEPFEFEIWSWNGESWTRVPTNAIPTAAAVTVKKPLGLFVNDQLYLEDYDGKILLFDCATGVLKNLGLNADYWCGQQIFPYFESSFALNGQKITRASSKMIKYNNNN